MAIASTRVTSFSCSYRRSHRRMVASEPERRNLRKTSVIGDFCHFGEAVRKDFDFFKKRIRRGAEWANQTFRLPQVVKTVDDIVWLRHLEDPRFSPPPLEHHKWPEPYYPQLSGVDLIMADLKALEAYALHFYYLSRRWSKPLPETYDPQQVDNYFSCRPHIVVLRLLEIFSSFASATIRIRAFGIRRSLGRGSNSGVDESSQYNFGVVLKETMLNLGPTFIKVGQSLSTRPDIIGSEISKALSELHDQIPPFSRTEALKIIEAEFSSPVESLFSHISEEPVAAASFGQVYLGSTIDGFKVAVKVQRPNLRHVVVRDIYILRLGLGILQKIAKRKNDLRLYADELGKGLVGELDYVLEAANASEFLEAHSQFSFMRVPKVLKNLTRKRVLTMEWMVGDSPNDLMSVAACRPFDRGSTYSERQIIEAKRLLLDMVSKGVEASLVQLLETGLLHADPHPGNLRYTSSGQIGFLDFGLLCRMERKHQDAMLASIVHIVNGDWPSLVQALSEMDVVKPGTNTRQVTMDLEEALGEVEFKDGIPDVKFSRVLGKIWSVALKYHFRMPPYYTLVLRSLASLEGLAVAVDPNFKTFEAAYPFVVRKLLTENSASARKILYSVVLNKKKEFHWQRLALFLRVGATRKSLQLLAAFSNETSVADLQDKADGVSGFSYVVLKLLPSKDGIVLRRLLMTADGASLVRAVVSKEAKLFQHLICKIVANILYQQVHRTLRLDDTVSQLGPSSRLSSEYDAASLVKDRRVKVIFLKVLNSVRKEPLLMLRFCWSCFIIFITASALACHRVLVTLSEVSLSRVAFGSKRFAVSST